MIQNRAQALLVCKDRGGSYLSDSLTRRGWVCEIAPCFETACQLIEIVRFDLVLSEVRMQQISTNPLIRFLTESRGSMFLSQSVEAGCWWLPAVRGGKVCWGAPALRPAEMACALDEIRAEVLRGALDMTEIPFSYSALGKDPSSEGTLVRPKSNSRMV